MEKDTPDRLVMINTTNNRTTEIKYIIIAFLFTVSIIAGVYYGVKKLSPGYVTLDIPPQETSGQGR